MAQNILEAPIERKYFFATTPAEEYRLKIGQILAKKWFSPPYVIAHLDENSDALVSKEEFQNYFQVPLILSTCRRSNLITSSEMLGFYASI